MRTTPSKTEASLRLFGRDMVTVRTDGRYFRLGAEQARRLGHSYIGSEHVLLGLASRKAGAAALVLEQLGATPELIEAEIRAHPSPPPPTAIDREALSTLGIDLDAVRTQLDQRFGEGALERTRRGCWPVEPTLKRALAQAVDEAGGQPPDDEHVLAALVMNADGGSARVLRELGVHSNELRRALRTT